MKKVEHILLGLALGVIGGYSVYVLLSSLFEPRILGSKASGNWLIMAVIVGAFVGGLAAIKLDKAGYRFKTWQKMLIWTVFIFLATYIYWFSSMIQKSIKNIQAL